MIHCLLHMPQVETCIVPRKELQTSKIWAKAGACVADIAVHAQKQTNYLDSIVLWTQAAPITMLVTLTDIVAGVEMASADGVLCADGIDAWPWQVHITWVGEEEIEQLSIAS